MFYDIKAILICIVFQIGLRVILNTFNQQNNFSSELWNMAELWPKKVCHYIE